MTLRAARYTTKALPWLFLIVGMAAHLVVRYFYPPVDFSAAWKLLTAGGLIVWAGIAYQMLWKQKRLWYPRSLVLAALGWLVSLFAFPSGAAMLLNGALDRSEPVIREARVSEHPCYVNTLHPEALVLTLSPRKWIPFFYDPNEWMGLVLFPLLLYVVFYVARDLARTRESASQ